MRETLTDEELAELAMRGDSESFAALCERQKRRLWRIACSVAAPGDAEDVDQEARFGPTAR